jgi:eukaryotic-like serine/threonine-protein kinase
MSGAISAEEIILGKYRIVRLLGEGGMARVWLAEEITFGNRQVALKEPRPDLPAADLADLRLRYEREVQTCAELEKLGASQVVRAITADPYDDSVLLVMEYLTGDLAKLISQHANGLPVERAVAITVAVLGALHTAHSHPWEIVHRDVKPSNILLDGQGNARLGDWGLAQSTYKSGRTQLIAGAHPGTQGYMAPEQISSPAPLNPCADIYALGCVLFEMLAGKRHQRFRPGTTLTSLRKDAPAWIDAVLAKALALDPWER